MPASQLICLQCQAVLKCAKVPRPDRAITCPKCGLRFFPSGQAPRFSVAALAAIVCAVALMAAAGAYWALSGPGDDIAATGPAGADLGGSDVGPAPAEASSQESSEAAQVPAPTSKPKQLKTYAEIKAAQSALGPPALALSGPSAPLHPRQAEINAAIAKGVAYLKRTQQPRGYWTENHFAGYASIGGLALLESGVPADDPAVQGAAGFVRGAPFAHAVTYQASLGVLFLDRLGAEQDKELLRHLAGRVLAGQSQQGGWSYECPRLTPPQLDTLLGLARSLSPDPGRDSSAAPQRPLLEVPGLPFEVGPEDNSNRQFALLGLWTARRHGVPTDEAVRIAAERLAQSQAEGRGWGYNRGGTRTGSTPAMTCVGLLGLAMGHGLKKAPHAEDQLAAAPPTADLPADPRITAGLQYLGRALDNPAHLDNLYFLWSLERVGELYQLQTIGDKDWYDLGVDFLLERQQEDGAWSRANYWGSTPELDTCFALLFLNRSNLVRDLSEQLPLRMSIGDPASRRVDRRPREAPSRIPLALPLSK